MPPAAKRKHTEENAGGLSESERRVEKAAILDRIQLLAQEVMDLTPPEAISLSTEYFRFMALKAANDTDGLPSKLAPSAQVDQLWHTHLLDTRSYAVLERHLLQNDGRLHHNPLRHEQPDYEDRLEYTRLLYSDTYHSAPPPDTWGALLLYEIDNGTVVKSENITIKVSSRDHEKIGIVIPRNATVKNVVEMCHKELNLSKPIQNYILRFDSQRMKGPNIPYELEDGDQIDLIEEQLGC